MPYVNVQITKGATRANKVKIVEDITRSLVDTLGKKTRAYSYRDPRSGRGRLGVFWNANRRLEKVS